MKLMIHVPCYNEQASIKELIDRIPYKIMGIDEIGILICDDGSTDQTMNILISHERPITIFRFDSHQGLAKTFQLGVRKCLEMGADIVVNIDADLQYNPEQIGILIQPLLGANADVAIGIRNFWNVSHFSIGKKVLHIVGSFFVSCLLTQLTKDVTTGFRAHKRKSLIELELVTSFTYTIESLFHFKSKKMDISQVKIDVNAPRRKSRLFNTNSEYLMNTLVSLYKIIVSRKYISF